MASLPVLIVLVIACFSTTSYADRGINPCVRGENERYHPHPTSNNKYIQCSDDGTSYVRHCNNGAVWSQYLRTCVAGSDDRDYSNAHAYEHQAQTYNGYSRGQGQPTSQLSYSDNAGVSTGYQSNAGVSTGYQSSPRYSYGYTAPYNYMYFMPSNRYYGHVPYGMYHSGRSQYTNHVQPSYSYQNSVYQRAAAPSYNMMSGGNQQQVESAPSQTYQRASQQSVVRYGSSNNQDRIDRMKGKSASNYLPAPVPAVPKTDPRCSDPSVRYIADPQDDSKYYECVYGHIHEHSCEAGALWVHPLRMCMDVNNRLNTAVPTMNPCAGTDAQYKAYPTDPSKYIECRAWYSVLVWSCRSNQIWVQEKQSCMDTSNLQSAIPHRVPKQQPPVTTRPRYQPQPQPQPTTRAPTPAPTYAAPRQPVYAGSNPCDNTTFYFAIIGKPHHFLQCDDFGNAFVRPCPTKNTWDDDIQTCVRRLGYQPDTASAVQVQSSIIPEKDLDFNAAVPLAADFSNAGSSSQYSSIRTDTEVSRHSSSSSISTGSASCNYGDFWIPSLQLCAKVSEAEKDSDLCHPGDYYFPKHHICASIKISGVEGKSASTSKTYSYSYTDYDSFIPDSGRARTDDVQSTDSVPSNHCAAKYGSYNGANPCGSTYTFYYQFAEDERCFIQCDQLGNMYVMSCPSVSVWNQDALQCVTYDTYQVNDLDAEQEEADSGNGYQVTHQFTSMRASGKSGVHQEVQQQQQQQQQFQQTSIHTTNQRSRTGRKGIQNLHSSSSSSSSQFKAHGSQNMCSVPGHTYYIAYPRNSHRFVMCTNMVPYILWCPQSNNWRQDLQSCFWPVPHH